MADRPPERPEGFEDATPSEILVYRVLHAQGPLTKSDLDRACWLYPRTVRRALDRLQERGAVMSTPDPSDRRSTVWTALPPCEVGD